jgi:hypothetical protein
MRLGPKPPMVPMVLAPAGLFERVGRHAPLPGGRLPGENKAGNARPGKLFELEGEMLAPSLGAGARFYQLTWARNSNSCG